MKTIKNWKTFLKLDKDADLTDYKLVLIGRLSLVAVVSILFLGVVNVVMKYPLINVMIDVVALLLVVVVIIAVRHRKVMLASLSTTIGLMAAISAGSIVSYTEMRNNGAENLVIAIIVLIVALFNSHLRIFLFLLSFGLLIWLKQYKMHVLGLPMDADFYVELVNMAIICSGIYFSTAFFKAGLQKNLDQVNKLNKGLNEQREMLANLNSEKDELIGIVAHDLKNPLHVISGALRSEVQLDSTLTDDQAKLLGAIEESSQGMVKHIAQILNINKMEAEGIHLIPKDHDLGLLLQKLIDLHRHSSDLKKIEIEADLDIGKHIVHVDENCVNRVFENLLSNAIKYTNPGKSILLSLVDMESEIQIRFQDQGLGISEADQENLFKKYESLSSKPTGNESSTGMGLFSVKKYLTAINGAIDVESVVGEGTTFIVSLPKGHG